MRQPAKTFNTPRTVRDPDGTLVNVLPEIPIEGSVSRARAIELDPIDIVGSRSADVEPFPGEALDTRGRNADGRSRMVPDWVPQFVLDAAGQPVEDERSGVTGYEVPAWAAEFLADSEGNMPTSMLGAGAEFASNLIPGRSYYRQFTGVEPSRESRTVNPLSATMGAVDAASLGFADDIAGLFDEDTGRELADARRYSQRQDPGSFALGEAVGTAPQMLLPGVSQGRGATTAARVGLGAAEGAGWGALEGIGRSDATDLQGRLTDALPGAVIGGVLGGALAGGAARMDARAAQPVDQRGVDDALDAAAWERLSQAGANQALTSRRQRILAPGTTERARTQSARRTVDTLRGEGVFDPGMLGLPAGPETIQRRIAERMPGAGDAIGGITQRMDGQDVDTAPLISHVEQRLAELDAIPGAEAQANAMRANLARFQEAARDGVTFGELQRWKTFWRQNTNFDAPLQADRQGVYGAISDTMQRGVEDVDPALGQQYRDARNMYRIGSAFEEAGGDQVRNDARLRRVSLSDYLTGLEGFQSGGVLGGVTGVLLNKGLRRNEHALRAASLERQAARLRAAPQRYGAWAQRLQAAQARGPRAFAAALYTAAQSDEAVRAQLAEQDEREGMRQAATADAPVFTSDNDADFFAPEVPIFDSEDDADFFRMEDDQ